MADSEIATKNPQLSRKIFRPLREDYIRLVTILAGSPADSIQCSLEEVPLLPDKKPPEEYEAFSYVCGSKERPQRIEIGGNEYFITENLAEALRALRHPKKGRKLWVDSLCINESNIPEKNIQIPLMGRIYYSACRVICWLGPYYEIRRWARTATEEDMKNFFNLLQLIESDPSNRNVLDTSIRALRTLDSNSQGRMMFALEDLVYREYWYRAWTLQEMALSSDLRVKCGDHTVRYTTLECMPTTLINAHALQSMPPKEKKTLHLKQSLRVSTVRSRLQGIWPERLLKFQQLRSGMSLDMFLNHFLNSHCFDRHDNIYAFYNLFHSDIQKTLQVDYDLPVEQAITQTFKGFIRVTKSLDVVTVKARQRAVNEKCQRAVPSWCPYLHAEYRAFPLLPAGYTYPKETSLIPPNAPVTFEYSRDQSKLLRNMFHRNLLNWEAREMAHIRECYTFLNKTTVKREEFPQVVLPDYRPSQSKVLDSLVQTNLHVPGNEEQFEALYQFKRRMHSRELCSCSLLLKNGFSSTFNLGVVADTPWPGDIICAISGCKTLVALRLVKDGAYQVVGEAMVQVAGLGKASCTGGSYENFILC
ncbi:HET domain-containing protein [Aspergillus thermomutatus]|uniref:Heterokaryon incompatibility domain-containing protein n=1 Tax=Aspergillus thermomutatus TaxID=41047 RepID=A0A397G0W4_ASPTH|nr:uncharacterized protein CDV56_101716 [Aspergillus thermomutatus]RHZ43464.1 hypothetical protein CDV56_101716 [Aspergillus thermomutatus]